MSILPQLLRVARQYHGAWARNSLSARAQSVLRAPVAASGGSGSSGTVLLPPQSSAPGLRLLCSSRSAASSGSSNASRSSSSSSRGTGQQQRRSRRRTVAAAGRGRGNMFLDDSAAARRPPSEDEPTSAGKLFDSSRFNYDSDEEELEEEQQAHGQQQHGQHQGAVAASAAQQQGVAEGAAEGAEADVAVDVVLPPPRGVKVKSAEFVKSSVNVEQCPPARFPEFAVIGRSNVGKSSLINMLTGRNSLAMVSKTPGKTRCINHFIINGAWYLVDLPGYGYARTGKANVVEWNRFTREYFTERDTLVSVLLLVDASIPPMALDISCATWFAEAEVPFTVVFTKLDKRKKGVSPSEENIAAFEAAVEEACGYLPPTILTSSKSGRGKNELLAHIAQLRDFFNKQHLGLNK